MATDAKTRIRSYYERLWNSRDESVIDEVCHEEFTDHWHQQSGTRAWKATAAELLRTFPDLNFESTLQIAEDALVATHWTMRGTDLGGLFRLAPTGKTAEFSGVFIDRLHGDRIAEHWAVSDMWRIMRHLEVVPASWRADSMLVSAEDIR